MRVQTEEWRRFIPGSRMYKGKKTLFYNGETLVDENQKCLIYDQEEQDSWEVIIILPGVEVIPEDTFGYLDVKTVVMADSVKRIEKGAFDECEKLVFVKLSRNLEYVGWMAFWGCKSLTSISIPPSCRMIDNYAFQCCTKLIILSVPRQTQLGEGVIDKTTLIFQSPFEVDEEGLARLITPSKRSSMALRNERD